MKAKEKCHSTGACKDNYVFGFNPFGHLFIFLLSY